MNQLAVAISIVLFPGLIACVICDKIIVHAQRWDAFKYAIYSFVFGLLSFTLLQAIVFIIDGRGYTLLGVDGLQRGSLSVWTMIEVEKYKINLVEVVWATLLAPLIAALAATTVNFKIINLISQKIGISRKYGDENLFSFFLDSPCQRRFKTDTVFVVPAI